MPVQITFRKLHTCITTTHDMEGTVTEFPFNA